MQTQIRNSLIRVFTDDEYIQFTFHLFDIHVLLLKIPMVKLYYVFNNCLFVQLKEFYNTI